jgi:hypothetical protein
MIRFSYLLKLISVSVLVCVAGVAGVASAQKPKPVTTGPTACNLKALPLSVGNTWTYKSGAYTIIIKVLEVGQGKDHAGKPVTTVTLEEQFGGRTVKSTLNCTPTGGLQVGLESFFFSGEPGGPVGSTLTVTAREKATLPADAELIADNGWVESVKADVVRTDAGGAGAVPPPAKLEVERHVTVKANENVMIGLGPFNPQKIVFELRGRGLVEADKTENPIRRPGALYLVKGVGFVKVEDAFDKTWELTETNLVAK